MFKMFRSVCSPVAACAAFLWAGASAADVLPAWRAIGDDASANAVVRCGVGQPPVRYADLTRRGSVELPVAGPNSRVLWDFSLPFDFMKADELSFDLRVDDLSGIKYASMHLKSGDGWYTTGLPVQAEGEWQRIRWDRRRQVSREGHPAFVLYSLPAGVGELLGVANAGFRRSGDKGAPRFAGLLRAGAGLEGQPAFTPQASNNANEPRLTGPGEVVAFWGDAQNRSLGIPALVKTSTGIYMGHVWRPAVAKDGDALLKSILGAFDPTFKASFAAADVRAKELAAKHQAFVRSVPGKAGERRLVWCHTAYGMTPDMDWDASVKFLKENGYIRYADGNFCFCDGCRRRFEAETGCTVAKARRAADAPPRQ